MQKILLGFSWGHRFPEPGLSNDAMAGEIAKIRNDFNLIVAQDEIAVALKPLGVIPDKIIGEPSIYMDTFQITEAIAQWAKNENINLGESDISVMCHATHWFGCNRILKRFNISAHRIPADIPYDPKSGHWYTRSPIHAFFGKILRSVKYFLQGKI